MPDYLFQFEELKQAIDTLANRYEKGNEALKVAIENTGSNAPNEAVQLTLAESKSILSTIQKTLPVKVSHQLDFMTKGWIISGMVLLIVTAVCIGLCGYLRADNHSLQATDIKYRMLRQVNPKATGWADSVYALNPDKAGQLLLKMENGVNTQPTIKAAIVKKQKHKRAFAK